MMKKWFDGSILIELAYYLLLSKVVSRIAPALRRSPLVLLDTFKYTGDEIGGGRSAYPAPPKFNIHILI